MVANEEPSSLKKRVKEFRKIDENTTLYSTNGIKANAQIQVELDVHLVLKNKKLKILGQPHDDRLTIQIYKANEDRINLKLAYCSENILEKQVVSNTTKLSSQGNKLTKFCAACKENLANTQELPKHKLLLGKIIIF